jgi:anti-sigma B factor antagonist
LQIKVSQQKDIFIAAFSGRLDAITASECEKTVDEIIGGGASLLVIDLGETDYVSSAGLRVILKAAKGLYGSGKLALARPQESVREVLEMTGFGEIVPIYDSLEAAVTNLATPL